MNTVSAVLFGMSAIANVLMALIFLSRIRDLKRTGSVSGLLFLFLLVPALYLLLSYTILWYRIYLALFVIFIVLELLLDYVLRIPFRKNRKILGPYILLYVLSFWGMIGMNFESGIYYGLAISALYLIHTAVMVKYELSAARKLQT